MHGAELFLVFVRRLNALGIPYMVTGSVASTAYGEPRLTHDIDLVMVIRRDQAAPLWSAFPANEFYVPPLEVIQSEAGRPLRGHFNILHHASGYKADCYLAGEEFLHAWGMARRRNIVVQGESIPFAPPEYVIVRKLQFYKESGFEKHLRDIRSMLEISEALIDRPQLDQLIKDSDLQDAWARVSESS